MLADLDGVYDPADYNDRLVLGLKGTISEAELHLIKQRMWNGRINKARRGELTFPLPSGYVRRPSGEVVFDPDEQVQSVIRLLFAQFERRGTLHGVLRYFVDHDIRLGIRLREGPDKGTLEWRRPNRMTLQTLLHNPAYAGVYAYGRRRVDPRRKYPARPSTGRVVQARDEWLVMIPMCCPPTSRWRSSRRMRRNSPPTGPAPGRWAPSVTDRLSRPGWSSAGVVTGAWSCVTPPSTAIPCPSICVHATSPTTGPCAPASF
ncbi:recombinase family protein [Streptomyces sp. NPDC018045]|uniref:recombinase family protein n=1 Tax=Streptomyces sp. NPDC018045 TaxID=3365037 RepID=UPI0037B39C30